MAYRRKQQVGRVSTLKEEFGTPSASAADGGSSPSPLVAKAIRASSANRDSSLSSAYGESAVSSPRHPISIRSPPSTTEGSSTHEYTSFKNSKETKQGFWGVLARKAKSLVDEDNVAQSNETTGRIGMPMSDRTIKGQHSEKYSVPESRRRTDGPAVQRGLDAIASSLSYIGGTIGNAFEEGLAVVENRTADIIQETRKLQIRKKSSNSVTGDRDLNVNSTRQPVMQTRMQPQMQTDLETQLKASRDVAMAMAAKAKLLLRELKTVKADLAFAKDRCAQLEEENRILRVSVEKGDNPEDDDLIRLQLETLLAEKARLAQENSVLARENRFLREVVEFHQLTMQDVVYLDENSEEVTEVYPVKVVSPLVKRDVSIHPVPPSEYKEASSDVTPLSSFIHIQPEDPEEK